MRVLVVEDERRLADLLARGLREAGELRVCANGEHHRGDRRFDVACTHPATGTTVTVLLTAVQPARRGAGGGAGAAVVG